MHTQQVQIDTYCGLDFLMIDNTEYFSFIYCLYIFENKNCSDLGLLQN